MDGRNDGQAGDQTIFCTRSHERIRHTDQAGERCEEEGMVREVYDGEKRDDGITRNQEEKLDNYDH